jgi:hypothetical protein
MPSSENKNKGSQIAKDGNKKPFNPNCSKVFVKPINKSHTPIA